MARLNFLKSAVITTSAVLILSSCEDKEESNKDNPKGWLLESIIVNTNYSENNNDQIKYEIEYDSKNRIAEVLFHRYSHWVDDWGGGSPTTLNYNADGYLEKYKLTGSRPRDGRNATFSRNGNKITFIHSGMIPGDWTYDGELELNDQELPIKLTYEYHEFGFTGREKNVLYTATFTWQNGNLIKADWEEEYLILGELVPEWERGEDFVEREEGSNTGSNTFTYDDKRTPFYHCNTPRWVLLWLNKFDTSLKGWYNANNIKTETSEDGSTRTYEYTYNDDGFPVTRTWATTWDGGITTYTETYTYKQ